jgi:hypothetical protein
MLWNGYYTSIWHNQAPFHDGVSNGSSDSWHWRFFHHIVGWGFAYNHNNASNADDPSSRIKCIAHRGDGYNY